MPNPIQLAGGQPPKPSRKAPLYQGARFSTGLWENRASVRDAASTRLEEKFYGPRGDALLGGENIEVSTRLTLVRRPGNSVWNTNTWSGINSFYEFRLFDSNSEQIKTMVDTSTALYDASNNGQVPIWNKSPYSGQSYMQSVANVLFWGDGVNQKKWVNTLQSRIPYSSVLSEIALFPQNASSELNPYNFTPFSLNSFVIDTNGNAQQLIETVLQLSSFYILNSTVVITMKPTDENGNPLPTASQVLTSGLEVYFADTTTIAQVLGGAAVTLTVQDIVGPLSAASVFFGGSGYLVNDIVDVAQTTPAGSMNGQAKVLTIGTSAGTGYTSAINVPTTTRGIGTGAKLNITATSGGLVSATVASGGVNYAVGDYVFPQQVGASGGYFKVTGVSVSAITSVALCTGCAKTVSVQTAGDGYVTAEDVPTTGGTGTGLTLDITDNGTQFACTFNYNGGGITSAIPTSAGSGYVVGDPVFPIVPSGSTAANGELLVATIFGTPATLALTYGGPSFTGYTVAAGLATTTSGSGTGATFNINSVTSGQISTFAINARGTGYSVGDSLFPVQATGAGAFYSITGILGPVLSASLTNAGPSFTGYTTGTAFPTTTGGIGTGLTVDISSVNGQGQITGIAVNAGGTGYVTGDHISPTVAGGAGADYTVTAAAGVVTGLTLINPGYLKYTTGTVPTTTSGIGTGATINITSVTGSQIAAGSIVSQGTNYAIGDFLFPTESGTSGTAYFTVTALNATTGGIAAISVVNPGYLPYAVATNIPTTTSGAGTGLTVDITTVVNGAITAGTLNAAGTGYAVGDRIYPAQSGTSGTAYFTVDTLTGATGAVSSLSVADAGTGYSSGSYSTSTSGAGTGLIVTLVVATSSFYPPTSTSDIPNVFSGGNPISSYTPNDQFIWNSTLGGTTIDGSALWINRGTAVNGGMVWNWGLTGGTTAPVPVVNGASSSWVADTYYNYWQFIIVTVSGSKYLQQLVQGGVSGGTPPVWNTTPGQITPDGSAKWKCLSNDGDTSLTWAAAQQYSVGHVIEDTPSGTACVYQLQPYTGIMTQGTNFPIYYWQCNAQGGSDVGSPGELPNGVSGNMAMAQNGGQTLTTANGQDTMNSLFLSCQGGSNPVKSFTIAGDGTLDGSGTTLFPATNNLSFIMLPSFVIPAAGTYTFKIGHQVGMFWGLGNGSITLNVTNIGVSGNTLTVTCDRTIDSLITAGIDLTFSGLANATWLNGQTITVTSVSGKNFYASFTHGNYGPASDTGTASSSSNLVPSVVSGPMIWKNPGSPNTYDFTTGTPVKGYKIMSANLNPTQGTNMEVDTVEISFPAAGVYPGEIAYGSWYHSTGSYSTPTTSPALPGTTFSFYMIYSQPSSSTFYNIVPQDIACSSALAPTFPDWPSTLADKQLLAPAYPSVTETSGNFTWWNLGPVTTFDWTASVNQTTSTFIIDGSSNKEIPYEAGVSGTTEPTFGTTLYELADDLTPLVWMNDGPAGSSPVGTITTTQGGWKYCVSLVNTLDDTVSNASIVSAATGSFFDASSVFVSGGLPDVIDPQADYVAIFRTQDGGSTYYLVPPPASGNGNTEYTIPISQYLAEGFTDTTQDADLDTFFQAPLALQNSVPPKGSINLAYQDGRVFVSSGTTVYWSSGPDTPVGNGTNAFNPNNYAEFPSLVKKLVPLNIGMMVFTVSDIFIITGNGTASSIFVAEAYENRVGLLNYNALTVNGSIIYFMSTDRQVLELNVHYGLTQIGLPIARILEGIDPDNAYLTWHVNGANDQCLFVADGSTGWYRMCPTPAPEAGSLTWSPKANIVGGCGAVQSIETSPGNIQYLVAPPPGTSGPILYRDYTNYEDNGSTYPANFILGSLVFAYPGQVAIMDFITTECIRVANSLPIAMGVRIGEIAGEFEDLVFWTNDPPQLPPSQSLYSQRFYLGQTAESIPCRHAQIYAEFAETNSADELMTLTVYGSYMVEA